MRDYTKGKTREMLEPFFPNEIFRHIIVSCFLVIIETAFVMVFPLPCKLVNKPDRVPWFLLPVYKLNKLVQNEAVFVSLIILCALLFVSWPFLERGGKRAALYPGREKAVRSGTEWGKKERRSLWQSPFSLIVVVAAILSVIALCFTNP